MDALTDPKPSNEIAKAQAELAQAVVLAGLSRDPLRLPLQALSTAIGAIGSVADDVRGTLEDTKSAIRQPISSEAEKEMVRRLSQSASHGASLHASALAKAHNLRTVFVAAGVLVAAIVVAAVGGYWWGLSVPVNTNVGQLPREVAQVLSANNMRQAIAECKPLPAQPNGRRACTMNVWME